MKFAGQRVLITGGAGGLGSSIALMLARRGLTVLITDYDAVNLARISALLRTEDCTYATVECDITNYKMVKNMVETLQDNYGPVDYLVNCTGVLSQGAFLDKAPTEWQKVFEINVLGLFNSCHVVLPEMVKQSFGKIVNISSVSASRGGGAAGNVVYAASKSAVETFSKGLAREFGPLGICVNTVAPGIIRTPMVRHWLESQDQLTIQRKFPRGRIAEPEDVSYTVAFLLSMEADYLTGVTIPVDGGFLISE